MAAGSLTCAAGFFLLARCTGAAAYFLAWSVLGAGMAAVLYEAAFATLNRAAGLGARHAISTLTLFGGFASTVFWPLTLQLERAAGWRHSYLLFGLAQLLLCLPLHLCLPRAAPRAHAGGAASADLSLPQALRHGSFWHLALAFSANSFIFAALSVHLIPILERAGHPATSVVFLAALIGPMQVAGRIGEMAFAGRSRPVNVGKICFAILPVALLALLLCGRQLGAVALFCVLYGLSNGILTIVRGTVPQQLFGARNFGAISGAMAGPSLLAKAAGPLVIAAVVARHPDPALLYGLLLACALASLLFFLLAVRGERLREPLAGAPL